RNDGRGHFTDVTRETLLRTSFGAIGCKAFDYDDDGRLDLFLADMHSDMWMNRDEEIVVLPATKYRSRFGPKAIGNRKIRELEDDYLEKAGLSYDVLLFGNSLFRNAGNGLFEELSDAAGAETFWPWGVAVGDFDNDGHEDMFLPSGMGYPFFRWPSCLLRNNGDATFTDVALREGLEPPIEGPYLPQPIGGQPAARSSRCAVTADFDGDGGLDLMVSNFNDRPYYFKNQFPRRHYVAFRLRGTTSNHDAVGAVVKLYFGERVMVRQVHATGGYLSQSSKTLHFGLGGLERIDRAEIRWPSGLRQTIESPAVDCLHEITEPE
ncbi:MAG TPA: CRTAC1 family protein, partial [Pirellulales bacterium]|nr:CRTAC1 family protein [Pirellulales bacterium]